jgi:hypothetical protein
MTNFGHTENDPLVRQGEVVPRGWHSTSRAKVWFDGSRPGLKKGMINNHLVLADEPVTAGGLGEYPSPLSYLVLAAGF